MQYDADGNYIEPKAVPIGLALMVTAFYLWRRSKPVWFIAAPTVVLLIMPVFLPIVSQLPVEELGFIGMLVVIALVAYLVLSGYFSPALCVVALALPAAPP